MPWPWHPFKIISLRHMERKTNLNEIYPLYDKKPFINKYNIAIQS